MHVLDGAGGDAGTEPLPDLGAELFPSEGHAVHAEWCVRIRGVEEPGYNADVCGVVGRRDGVRRTTPVCLLKLS